MELQTMTKLDSLKKELSSLRSSLFVTVFSSFLFIISLIVANYYELESESWIIMVGVIGLICPSIFTIWAIKRMCKIKKEIEQIKEKI